VAVITSNAELAAAPGNVRLSRRESRLPRDSVVNVSQLLTLDWRILAEKVGRLPKSALSDVEAGVRLVLAL
jgi:mRNA interferase MazF